MDRDEIVSAVTRYTCSQNCFGSRGHHGGCCAVGDRDWIIGPVLDPGEFLERLATHLGRLVEPDEALVSFEQGRLIFPERTTWQVEENFPAMRLDLHGSWRSCKFYDPSSRGCSIHSIRPQLCRDYFCEHLTKITEML